MSIITINTAFNIDLEFEIAAFHKRLFAYLIDLTILVAYRMGMAYFLSETLSLWYYDNMAIYLLVLSVPMIFYSLACELWFNGQTVGKKIMSIRVISLNGEEPAFGQYLLRWITKFFEWPLVIGSVFRYSQPLISFIIITGFLGIAVVISITATKKNQRLGDLAAGTVIVDTKTVLGVEDTVFMDVKMQDYQPLFPEVMRLSDGDINTIKNVLTQAKKTKNEDMCYRVEAKVKQVLSIQSGLLPVQFLEKLLEDYNYLATKE